MAHHSTRHKATPHWHISGSSRLRMDVPTHLFTPDAHTSLTETTRELGRKQYEISNHLANVLSVITDQKLPVEVGSLIVSYSAVVVTATDYSPFGVGLYGRSWSGEYRYGFNGKESDITYSDPKLQLYDYGMRMYAPALGRFLTVDPIYFKYPSLSIYQYASNTPIRAIDQDGLEAANIDADKIVDKYGYDALPIAPVCDGFGDIQLQTYTLKIMNVGPAFTTFRETFLSSPQTITNNFYANYYPVKTEKSDKLTAGDIIKIDILGPENNSYVVVHDIVETENYFSMTFLTLYGHTEAGYITFSGVYDTENNCMTFEIFNSTRSNHGLQSVTFKLDRSAQIDQWEDVIGNACEFLRSENPDIKPTDTSASWYIEEYSYDSENCKIGEIDWTDSEEIDTNE